MDSGFQAVDSGFDVTVTTWFQIPTVSGIPDSLSREFWISKALNSGFHKQTFGGPDCRTWGDMSI